MFEEKKPLISVMIPSSGRESLIKTVQSIFDLERPDFDLEIIVVDDSADRACQTLLSAFVDHSIPLHIIPLHTQNICAARNACLFHAQGHYVAFIDDDEWAEPSWLVEMLEGLRAFEADIVIGPVKGHVHESVSAWKRHSTLFDKNPGHHGQVLKTGSTSNALIRHTALEKYTVSFDEDFGRTGGGDTDFFARMVRKGARSVALEKGCVNEYLPANRASLHSLLKRSIRSGQTYARMESYDLSPRDKMFFYLKAIFYCFSGFALALFYFVVWQRAKALHYLIRSFSNIGKLRYMFGLPFIKIYNPKKTNI